VRAEIHTIGGLSAHADQAALLGWLGAFKRPPRQTHIVHGEPIAAEALRKQMVERLGWQPSIARAGATVPLYA
jgi:metallo-beta-lactamase family protein